MKYTPASYVLTFQHSPPTTHTQHTPFLAGQHINMELMDEATTPAAASASPAAVAPSGEGLHAPTAATATPTPMRACIYESMQTRSYRRHPHQSMRLCLLYTPMCMPCPRRHAPLLQCAETATDSSAASGARRCAASPPSPASYTSMASATSASDVMTSYDALLVLLLMLLSLLLAHTSAPAPTLVSLTISCCCCATR